MEGPNGVLTRRRLLQAGTAVSLGSLTGCLDLIRTEGGEGNTPRTTATGVATGGNTPESAGGESSPGGGTKTAGSQRPAYDWLFGYDAANTGDAGPEAEIRSSVEREWLFQPQNGGYPVRSDPAVADGMVYVGADDRTLYALDRETGETVWTVELQFRIDSSPAVGEDSLYVSGYDTVYALNPETGETRWEREVDRVAGSSPVVAGPKVYIGGSEGLYVLDARTGSANRLAETSARFDDAIPIVDDGVVYILGGKRTLYAIQATNGEIEWKVDVGDRIKTTPAVGEETVFVGIDQWHDSGERSVLAVNRSNGDVQWTLDTGRVATSPSVGGGVVYIWVRERDTGGLYALDTATGKTRWRAEINDEVTPPPRIADGTVYAGSRDGRLYAVDSATGDIRWKYRTGSDVSSSPAVADGAIYFGSDDGSVYAVMADSGEKVWEHETKSRFGAPAVVGETVYAGSWDNHLYAVDAETSEPRWTVELGGKVESTPAVADDTVYAASRDGRLHAFDTGTGERRWEYDAADRFTASPAVVDGALYIGGLDTGMYALDADAGEKRWSVEIDDRITSSPAVAEETVYVAGGEAGVYALNAETGETRWSINPGNEFEAAPAVVDGVVYVGGSEGDVYALDAASGEIRWVFESGERIRTAPAVVDGTIFLGLGPNLYAIDPERGTPVWVAKGINSSITSPPIVANETVCIGSIGEVRALETGTGDSRWAFEFGDWVHTSPSLSGGVLYVGADGLYKMA